MVKKINKLLFFSFFKYLILFIYQVRTQDLETINEFCSLLGMLDFPLKIKGSKSDNGYMT